jgi:hypothetical protein
MILDAKAIPHGRLMDYLLTMKDGAAADQLISQQPAIDTSAYDLVLSMGGLSDRFARKHGKVGGHFYKSRPISMKYIPVEQRHCHQNFLGLDTDVRGKAVLVVDDIHTTGSTLREAFRVLQEAGARSYNGLTLFKII